MIARDRRITLLVIGLEQTGHITQEALSASADQANTENIATLLAHVTAS